MHTFHQTQNLPITLDKAWDFFSDPKNLKTITPEYMGFDIKGGADRRMYPGQIIEYRVSPLLGIKTKWVTEITHVIPNQYFVDEQRFGPYTLWHHKHFIKAIPGGVEMIEKSRKPSSDIDKVRGMGVAVKARKSVFVLNFLSISF